MNKSTTIAEISKELNRIQKEIKAPKSQRNTFGNYNYRNAEDILEAYKKIAGETTLLITDEIVLVGERYYVKATTTLSLGDESIPTTAFAREAENKKGMDESQITGATSSYARKYALNALFAIDDTKDADSQDNSHVEKKQEVSEALKEQINQCTTKEQLKTLWEANKGLGKDFATLITTQKKFIESADKDIV